MELEDAKIVNEIRGFESGDYKCECGEVVHLYWNGGELDEKECKCGKFYRTEHQEVNLVIYESEPKDS